MPILVLNCGSSSIKYQLRDTGSLELLAKGLVERVGMSDSTLTHKNIQKGLTHNAEGCAPTHAEGLKAVLDLICDGKLGNLQSLDELSAVGHRVAHGGEYFKGSALVDDTAEQHIEACCPLAPLHNPANLTGIRVIKQLLPSVPQVAVFDTAFHQSMPAESYMYAIPYAWYEKYRVRRYGFHGTSHEFVSRRAADFLNTPVEKLKIVSCHLGNGASITAIKEGKSFATSMGFTPLEGLVMGTRSGDIDAGILPFIAEREKLSLEEILKALNGQSGMHGVSGVSSDMRDLEAALEKGNERARLARNLFSQRVLHYVGGYAARMGGVDAILFTGGIGEHDRMVRQEVCQRLAFLGLKLNAEANDHPKGDVTLISTPESALKALVIATDEEFVIANDTKRLARV